MEELEDGPGPSSSSKEHNKGECAEASNCPDAVSITLPEQLQKITPAEEFVRVRHRWNTSEEIASILIAFDRHKEWLMLPQKIRPASGSMLLYNRKLVFYRRDGYCWKKRRNGSTIREDHMKLKVQGLECIYGSYVHSAILPTFHRRCYWLLQNPNIVLLHYLNVPYPEAAKPSILTVFSELKQKEWTKEQLVDQLRPMLSQVGQATEEDTDEEKKVERILEELLPLLMPSKDEKSKHVFSLSHGLGNRILSPAHTATLNRLIAPRQTPSSSQLQVYHQPQPSQKQEQEGLISQNHQMKTKDVQMQLPLLVKNATAQQMSHKGQNPIQITAHSQYQSMLFRVPTEDNSLSNLASKSLQNETSICTVKGDSKSNIPLQQANPSVNIFSSDPDNPVQQQNVEKHQQHNVQQHLSSLQQPRMVMHNSIVNNLIVPTTSMSSIESDTEMADSFVSHCLAISKEGALDTLVKKNPAFPNTPCCLNSSSLNSLMEADVNAPSVAAMDVTLQSQGQMMQQPLHPSHSYLKDAQACTHQISTHHQQQNFSQLQQVAQQNHSPVLQSLAQNPNQHPSQPPPNMIQFQQPQHQTPLLTLHLKSATNSIDNNPGFVLSLQGATLVNQESSSVPMSSGNPAQSLNISNSNGLVLIASQNQSGQLVLNRISDNDNNTYNNHSSTHQISTTAAPGAPYIMSASSASTSSEQPTSFKTELNNLSTHSNSAINQGVTSIQPPIGFQGSSSHNPNVFSSSKMSHMNLLPSLSCPLNGPNTVNIVSQQQSVTGFASVSPLKDQSFQKTSSFEKFALPSSVRKNNLTRTSPSSQSSLSMTTSVHDPTKDLRKPMLFSLDSTATATTNTPSMPETKDFNKMDMSSSNLVGTQAAVLQSQQASHDSVINNLHNFCHNDKDMISNPDSCDTLDGSFSSLPTSDLNLDDFLDLHDLQDLTVSPLGPVDIPTNSPTTSHYCWDNNTLMSANPGLVDSHIHSMGKTAASDRSVDVLHNNKSDVSHAATDHLHLHNHQHQPHQPRFLSCHEVYENRHQISPTSPNHPGAPPRTFPKFTPQTSVTTPPISLPCTSAPLLSPSQENNLHCDSHNTVAEDPDIGSVIKDFAPSWAFSKTNTKLLVAGPWNKKDAQYTCVFDGDHTLAVLLQPGLLRCYTPFHNAGYSTFQVARDGVIVSNCEIFEFCDNEKQKAKAVHPEWFDFEKTKLKMLLMERLDQLQRQLTSLSISSQELNDHDDETIEHNLVERVEKLLGQLWINNDQYPKAGQHNLTLLHLAASLGLAKFISCLIKWRVENSSVALDYEVDALSVDSQSCTPLMWACSLGNIDAALTLYRWNGLPLKMCNKDGLLPLSIARQKGHYNLANQIEQLERSKKEDNDKTVSSFCQENPLHLNMDITSPPASSTPGLMDVHKSMGMENKEKKELSQTVSSFRAPHSTFPKPVTAGPKLIRRFSEQALGQSKGTLNKRNSVDILPSGLDIDQATLPTLGSSLATSREATSEPQLTVSPDMAYIASPAPRLLLEDKIDEPSCVYTPEPSTSRMDTDEPVLARSSSPIIDVERISSDEELDQEKDGSKHQMVTLANQIIAAIPERIKLSPSKSDDLDDTASSGRGRSESHSSLPSQGSPRPSSFGDDSGISTPVTESLAFEEYRYPEFGTPASSLSPESTCLPSPYSPYSFTLDSPPPTTAEFTEYFNAPTTYMEKDFSQLTLSDQEQRKLYEAAKVIQNAYRHYRDKQMQQQKEIEAAVLIQSYYRRYKTYAYYKKMSHAAVLIQNQFRTYYAKRKKRVDSSGTLQGLRRESERLKKGRNQSVIIQQRFRSHYQRRSFEGKEASGSGQGSGDAPNSSPPPPTTNCQCPDEPQTITVDNSDPGRTLEEQKGGQELVADNCGNCGNAGAES